MIITTIKMFLIFFLVRGGTGLLMITGHKDWAYWSLLVYIFEILFLILAIKIEETH